MKTFKDTQYGDLTGKTYAEGFGINVNREGITSLEGAPLRVEKGYFSVDCNKLKSLKHSPEFVAGSFYCRDNDLTSLEFAPKEIVGAFHCNMNFQVINQRGQIIQYGIKASEYITDEGRFTYEQIKDAMELPSRVSSKGFRILLGLDK